MTSATLPTQMTGVVLTGHGGLEKLEYKTDLPVPQPAAGEVLIRVGAAGVNNTDINTRIGWYSKSISGQTNEGGESGFSSVDEDDASWSGIPLQFPRIQGADACGEIVAIGEGVDPSRIGERVMVRTLQEPLQGEPDDSYACITFGSECDGGFAQYTVSKSSAAFTVNSDLTDVELASFPCAYSTAENMIDRANVQAGETVLITGASGGVGSAAIQLAKRRNARVIAISGADKMDTVKEIGADLIVDRKTSISEVLERDSIDVVVDLVAGPQWSELLDVLRPGGRYAVAGAIAGPMVDLDVRTLYLKDLTFFGCTYQPRHVFENLVTYIEQGELKPLVAKEFTLQDIREAQEVFLAKQFVGKLVLVPPTV